MWGGIVGLIIQLVAGGVGGNVAGSMLKQYDLGTVGNTIAGVVGGGVGAQILGQLVGGGGDVTGAGSHRRGDLPLEPGRSARSQPRQAPVSHERTRKEASPDAEPLRPRHTHREPQ
jgi:uncharacterized membrane protein YeaQ/YmgE (transglycosylase-associated protein family)